MCYLSVEEILKLHSWVIDEFGGSHGVRDELGLRSLAQAPQTTMFGEEQYASLHEKAAVYMRNCIADHVFTDGNKRTAVTIAGVFLQRNGWRLTAHPRQLEDFAVTVATDHLSITDIAQWLRCHTEAGA